jgi:DNA-directed RNA polymerase beta subunit
MWCGNCAKILPDEEMPKDEKGRPLEVLFDPLGIVSRTNPSQLM